MILIVAAHCDDEVLGCGGLMAKTQEVCRVLLFGPGRYEADVIKQRLPGNYHLLTYFEDQEYDRYPLKRLAGHIEGLIDRWRFDTVLTHSLHDVNQDHRQINMATLIATRPKPGSPVKKVMTYEVLGSTGWEYSSNPACMVNVYVPLTPQEVDKKINMMEDLYLTEMKHPRDAHDITSLAEYRGHQVGIGYAEAYELVRDVWNLK